MLVEERIMKKDEKNLVDYTGLGCKLMHVKLYLSLLACAKKIDTFYTFQVVIL